MRGQQKLDELDVAAGKRVMQRGTAAPVLTIVRVGAALDEARGNREPCFPEFGWLTIARCDLVQPTIKKALRDACEAAAETVRPWCELLHGSPAKFA